MYDPKIVIKSDSIVRRAAARLFEEKIPNLLFPVVSTLVVDHNNEHLCTRPTVYKMEKKMHPLCIQFLRKYRALGPEVSVRSGSVSF